MRAEFIEDLERGQVRIEHWGDSDRRESFVFAGPGGFIEGCGLVCVPLQASRNWSPSVTYVLSPGGLGVRVSGVSAFREPS